MKSRVHPKYKTKYHVGNWPAYDRALVQRGDVTLWLAPEAVATWEAVGVGTRGALVHGPERGRPVSPSAPDAAVPQTRIESHWRSYWATWA